MTLANSSETMSGGGSGATHTTGGKEHPVVMIANTDGHILGSKDTYFAVNKLAVENAVSALTFAQVANTDKVWAVLYHTGSATRRVTLKKVEMFIAATAATILNVELRRTTNVTLPVTGNPAVTPVAADPASQVAESICLSLPTTPPSMLVNQPLFSQEFNLGANTAQTTSWPADAISLWPPEGMSAGDDWMEPVIRAGQTEGYAVVVRSTAAVSIKGTIRWIFTEES